jgi:lipoate-protein ligase A
LHGVPATPLHLVRHTAGAPASLEVAVSHALLLRVARRELPALVRVYRPAPTVAFGKLDALTAGYRDAVRAARGSGYEPVLRAPGGHAAAYDEGTVGFDYVVPVETPFGALRDIFEGVAGALAGALGGLGVDARVGPVPGEYCRGDFTVNAQGRAKLAGTAQRAIRGGSLLGGFVTVAGSARLRAVLEPVYAALALEWDPASLGAVEDEVPGVGVDAVERAVVTALAGGDGEPAALDAASLALARELEPAHRIDT